MVANALRSFVRVSSLFAVTLLFAGCGGGEQTTGSAPELTPAAQKANDAYVNQYAKESMKDKSKEKPGSSKAAAGAAPGPGGAAPGPGGN
ncbi:hypothetical protein GC170_02410 [bacterium]|nr:hypothetical protein [bacterium]